jgi:hypothetical protein
MMLPLRFLLGDRIAGAHPNSDCMLKADDSMPHLDRVWHGWHRWHRCRHAQLPRLRRRLVQAAALPRAPRRMLQDDDEHRVRSAGHVIQLCGPSRSVLCAQRHEV